MEEVELGRREKIRRDEPSSEKLQADDAKFPAPDEQRDPSDHSAPNKKRSIYDQDYYTILILKSNQRFDS